jgi:hypothetical protein
MLVQLRMGMKGRRTAEPRLCLDAGWPSVCRQRQCILAGLMVVTAGAMLVRGMLVLLRMGTRGRRTAELRSLLACRLFFSAAPRLCGIHMCCWCC